MILVSLTTISAVSQIVLNENGKPGMAFSLCWKTENLCITENHWEILVVKKVVATLSRVYPSFFI